MKTILSPTVLILGGIIVAAIVIFTQTDLVDRWKMHAQLDDLIHARHPEETKRLLRDAPRGPVVEALKEAVDGDGGTPAGKAHALSLLAEFREDRAVARAVRSNNVDTRRAAAFLRRGVRGEEAETAKVAVEWLQDEGAADRYLAVMIIHVTKHKAAAPLLVDIVKKEASNPDSLKVVGQTLRTLSEFEQPGLAEIVLPIAKNPEAHATLRTGAFRVLARADDAPRDEVRELLLAVIKDTANDTTLRDTAITQLGFMKDADAAVWDALKAVLFDDSEANRRLGRAALRALGRNYPLDKLPAVLLDRRAYAHKAMGVRHDVATALGTLRAKYQLTLDVLSKLVGDDDPTDFQDGIVRNAWLSYWLLTGMVYGVEEKDVSLFRNRPNQQTGEELQREYLFSFRHSHPSISKAQDDALSRFCLSADDGKIRQMDPDQFLKIKQEKAALQKQIQQTFESKKGALSAGWPAAPK